MTNDQDACKRVLRHIPITDSTKTSGRRTKVSVLSWLFLSILSCTVTNFILIGHHGRFDLNSHEYHSLDHYTLLSPPRSSRSSYSRKERRQSKKKEQTTEVTAILRGEKPFPNKDINQLIKFRPGDLQMSSVEALQHCHVDASEYKNHVKSGRSTLVSISKAHKLIYRNIPKSASSSARLAMETYFHGQDRNIKFQELRHIVNNRNYTLVSFIREPLSRFYSSYDEALYRWGPWMGSQTKAERQPGVAKTYHLNKHKLDKYRYYLYEGMETEEEYRRSFCPEELLHKSDAKVACYGAPSIDNGTLTQRFERFVQDYNGDPFDVHLTLQVPHLLDGKTGHPLPVSTLYNASEAETGWRDLSNEKGVHIPLNGLEVARSRKRTFNMSLVSNATKQKICRLMALDYCCLNLQLPEVCRGEDGVHCALQKHDDVPKKEKQRLFIHPIGT